MDGRDRPKPVPRDEELDSWLLSEIEEHTEELEEQLDELVQLILKRTGEGQPRSFAYGKLLNYLASDYMPEPKKIRCLAAAMWRLIELVEEA